MVDEAKYIEHTIHGSVPSAEWGKFLNQHFVPSATGASKAERAPTSAAGICGALGCPATYGGGTLHHCSVDVESDGSTTIHCHYALITRKP